MIILKHLPAAQEPRLYMALERTYLGYFKLIFVMIGSGLIVERLAMLFHAIHSYRLFIFFHEIHHLFTWLGITMMFIVSYRFLTDLKYIEKGVIMSANEVIDPRVYMAAERTFLAWVRTGIGLVAFGFLIEKFNFFLKQLSITLHIKLTPDVNFSGIGIVFIVLGVSNLVIGGINFINTVKQVDQGCYRINKTLYTLYGIILLIITIVLTGMIINISF